MHVSSRAVGRFSAIVLTLLAAAACGGDSQNAGGNEPAPVVPGGPGGNGARDGGDGEPGDGAAPPPSGEPSLEAPASSTLDEEQELVLAPVSTGLQRFDAEGLPPGARLDHRTGTLTFRPDFTQSGHYEVRLTGYAGGPPATFTKTVQFAIDVRDSIAPPPPIVVSSIAREGYHEVLLRQVTDGFLDSAGRAGRSFDAKLAVPDALTDAKSAPVQLWFHGFGGGPTASAVSYFMLAPHDPDNTYWYGYGEDGPSPTAGHVQPYTARRAMHLLDWVMRTYPATNPERVFTGGDSMGGAGAMTIGMLYARHFAGILSTIGQSIPRHHHDARITQLTTHWGSPASNLDGVWDALDLTRVLRDSPEARDQFVSTKHGKDDKVILFGAMVKPSPLTGLSFYDTLETLRIGHLSVWDEGGHGTIDPVLGAGWPDNGWSRMFDPKSRLERHLPFPAFTHSSANDDHGGGQGNGRIAYTELGGFAGNEAVGGDTGWGGAIAGALNRFLRWDSTGIQLSRDRLSMPLYVVTAPGQPAPRAGYPTKRDLYTGPLPITVDVTPRRTHAFAPLPGERVRWKFGGLTGSAVAAEDGSVSIPQLPLRAEATVLELERDPP